MGIRSTSKAIIINKGSILLNRCSDEHNGEYYCMPGGGQNMYETMEQAVVREVLEETGYEIKVKSFAGICELICDDEYMRKERPLYSHKMYHIFLCGLSSEVKKEPTETDNMQITSEWINLSDVHSIKLMPQCLAQNIDEIIKCEKPLFLGSYHIPYNHG